MTTLTHILYVTILLGCIVRKVHGNFEFTLCSFTLQLLFLQNCVCMCVSCLYLTYMFDVGMMIRFSETRPPHRQHAPLRFYLYTVIILSVQRILFSSFQSKNIWSCLKDSKHDMWLQICFWKNVHKASIQIQSVAVVTQQLCTCTYVHMLSPIS